MMTFKQAKDKCPDGGSIYQESSPNPVLFKDNDFEGIEAMPPKAKTAKDWKVAE